MTAFPRPLLAIALAIATALPGQEAAKASTGGREQLLAFTRSDDPLLRGEAALALAEIGNPDDGERLIELTRDPSPVCASRALLAIGQLAPLGFEMILERVSNDERRGSLIREAAFYALGATRSEDALTTTGRVFAQFDGASFSRSRYRLAALVSGLGRSGDEARAEWVRRLLDDSALRDPQLRALVVASLRAMNAGPEREELDELLEHPIAEIRAAAARTVAQAAFELDGPLSRTLMSLATRDRNVSVRHAALIALDKRGFEPLVGPSRRAILQDDPELAALGARILLRSGTSKDRKKVIDRIRRGSAASDAMLGVWRGPSPTSLSEYALEVAENTSHSAVGRLAALRLDDVVGAEQQRRILRELLRSSTDPLVLEGALELLATLAPDASPTEDLGDLSKAEPERWATRLRALASVQPERAEALLSDLLRLDDPAVAATALSARRSGRSQVQQRWLRPLSPALRTVVSGSALDS